MKRKIKKIRLYNYIQRFLLIACLIFIFQVSYGIKSTKGTMVSIQKFGVLPGNSAELNRVNLQNAIINFILPSGLYYAPVNQGTITKIDLNNLSK